MEVPEESRAEERTIETIGSPGEIGLTFLARPPLSKLATLGIAGRRDLADIAVASGLLRFERPLKCLPSSFRRLYARLGTPFVYTRFSQTSTGEKKLAGGVSPFGQGQRGAWTKAPPTRTLYRWAALTNLG